MTRPDDGDTGLEVESGPVLCAAEGIRKLLTQGERVAREHVRRTDSGPNPAVVRAVTERRCRTSACEACGTDAAEPPHLVAVGEGESDPAAPGRRGARPAASPGVQPW